MTKNESSQPAVPSAERRACEDCNEYTDHMSHRGLIYRFFYDEKGGYHRHIWRCFDRPAVPAEPEKAGKVN
jgi:hypothetical protein